jgi:hypothetical protein
MTPLAPQHFFDIVSKTARFSEKVVENKMCILILSTTFV